MRKTPPGAVIEIRAQSGVGEPPPERRLERSGPALRITGEEGWSRRTFQAEGRANSKDTKVSTSSIKRAE